MEGINLLDMQRRKQKSIWEENLPFINEGSNYNHHRCVCPVFCLVCSMVPHQFLHCWGHNCSCSQWLWYNFVLIWKNVCPLSHDRLPACPGRAHHRHQHPVNNYLFLPVCNYLQRRRRTLGNPVSIIWWSRFFNCLRTGTQISINVLI